MKLIQLLKELEINNPTIPKFKNNIELKDYLNKNQNMKIELLKLIGEDNGMDIIQYFENSEVQVNEKCTIYAYMLEQNGEDYPELYISINDISYDNFFANNLYNIRFRSNIIYYNITE